VEYNRELLDKIENIFLPYAASRKSALLARRGRLVHYTTAENAIKIIKSKSLWMRNARVMNDFSEVEHGFSQLRGYFQNQTYRDKLYAALDRCALNAGKEAIALFDQRWMNIQYNTYICCLSEHNDDEDAHGRLSMWRAFGRSTAGVAIVMKTPEPDSANTLQVFLHPVAYFTHDGLLNEMENIITNIKNNEDMLKELPHNDLVGWIYMMLMMPVVSLKHPGFHEEKEWRLLHMPAQFQSEHVPESTEIIDGVPQVVRKILLKNKPEAQITGIELPQLIDRVIIGPTQYAVPIFHSLIKELAEAGVENAATKVVVSNIPLRS
jgi:hypothetical protein